MSERFIKYIPNSKASWLRQHHTALYLLLSLAIERAKWTSEECHLGLQQGDAILGSFEEAGISRQQYRDAIEKGESLKIWEVVYNRKCKKLLESPKRTIKGTIKTIVVNVYNPMIWDLNLNRENHQSNHQGTIREPSENHKEEDKKDQNDQKDQDLIDATARDQWIEKFSFLGFSQKEIDYAINSTNEQIKKGTVVGNKERYLETSLKNNRKFGDKKCKKTQKKENLKTKSDTDKGYYLGSDLSEAPLAKVARLSGLN